MKVLVSAASKHGATTEVAATIAAVLGTAGVEAIVVSPSEITSVDGFEAAVIGSGVYAGRWLEPAKGLLERHREAFSRIPVWLFSSGPVGDPLKPGDDPVDAAPMAALIGARGHRVFGGFIDKRKLGLGEKAIVAAVRAPEGDFRPWSEIEGWGRQIARELQGAPASYGA